MESIQRKYFQRTNHRIRKIVDRFHFLFL